MNEVFPGAKIGKWTVFTKYKFGHRWLWLCKCQCGTEQYIRPEILRRDGCQQCSKCKRDEQLAKHRIEPGTRFNKWTVIEERKQVKGHPTYLCKCECGNKHVLRGSNLRHGLTRSCRQCSIIEQSGAKSSGWKGHEEITGYCWSRIRCNARARDIDISITIEYAWLMFIEQGRKCALSGVPLTHAVGRRRGTASLDRIDSSKGYIIGNVQWIHKDLSDMKMDKEEPAFFTWCKTITEYQEKKNAKSQAC